MTTISQRISQCFSNVFPNLRADEISRASTSSVAAWDSVAHITLLSAIAEEFQFEFSPEDFEQLISFPLIVEYVEQRINHD
jgi:acyl carrier protein